MKYNGTSLEHFESKELMPGFHGKFVHTDDMTLAYWKIDAGSVLPEHSHFHKQIVQVQEGVFEMTVGGETHRFQAGDVLEIPGDVVHSGRAITDCVIHDIFVPAREEYK